MTAPIRWEEVGSVPPRALTEARLVVHHAAQLVAAVGRNLAPASPDDGHTSLTWRAEGGDLVGAEVSGPRPWRAALRPSDLSLAVVAEGSVVNRLALEGHTEAVAFAWLLGAARGLAAPVERLTLTAPYALPAHPIGSGAAYARPAGGATPEIGRWIANADALLLRVAEGWSGAAPVRLWPHHFDVGSVLPLAAGLGHDDPSIGIGLSLGDEGIAEPYLYVNPWPPPAPEALPALPGGRRWHVEGWIGAVLTGSEIVSAGAGAAQATLASTFLAETVELLRSRHAPQKP